MTVNMKKRLNLIKEKLEDEDTRGIINYVVVYAYPNIT